MRIMLSCGEPSGDLYAGALVTELRRREPAVEVFGFGGQHLEDAGGRLVGHIGGLSVTGITEAVRLLPRSYAMLRRLVAAAREQKPDVFVAVDFPDFNFRLMAAIHRLGIPVVYYISPQLWAWRPGRMNTMKRLVDLVLVIFPFEEPLYQRHGVPVRFVGHPLVEMARATESRADFLRAHGLVPDAPTVALLPGSRPNELKRIAPDMAAAVPLIRTAVPQTQFVIARAPGLPDALFAPLTVGQVVRGTDTAGRPGEGRAPVLVQGRTDDVLAASDVVVTASGTATVQAALHERPMVVVYRLSPLTYRIAKPFAKVDTYAMANLVLGRRVVPELIQEEFTPARVAHETVRLITDRELHHRTRDELTRVRGLLGTAGASGRAADAILEVAARRCGASGR